MGFGLFKELDETDIRFGVIDIDNAVDETGTLSELAQDVISTMASYVEFSPSRKGVHIYFLAPKYFFDEKAYYINNRKLGLEVYIGRNRFMTVTGYKLPSYDYSIEKREKEVALILEKYMQRPQKTKKPPKSKSSSPATKLTDDEIIAKASKSKRGEEFLRLWQGDWAESFDSQSEADLKLASHLAFWCNGDIDQIDRLFRKSALFREKWDENRGADTYGKMTLEKAVQECTNFYGQFSENAQSRKIIDPLKNENRYSCDDKGNGNLFADSFKNELRFCPEMKEWFFYEKGIRWKPGGNETAREKAKEVADYLQKVAFKIQDEDKRARYDKNASLLRNQSKRETMLKDAQSVHPLYLSQLDTDIKLLNCGNGTLDLEKGKFLPHNSAHMLAKVAGADYVSGARCERWEKFIDEIMMSDQDMARFLQKLFGYALTGNCKEEKLFILYGPKARNGKSTTLDTIAKIMGDYAKSMLPETLAVQRNPDGGKASPEWAEMRGVRLCAVSEPSQGLHIDAAKLKSATGRNPIKARFLYANSFQYNPQFSIVIDTNHRPVISDNTLFASDRIVIIPFNRHFEEHERDPNLKSELLEPEARSGILSWMLEGLKLYRKEGLNPPQSIKDEIARYELESDKMAQFIEECIEVVQGQGTAVLISTVYAAYKSWCTINGYHAKLQKNFKADLEVKGMQIKKKNIGICVLDINVTGHIF